MDRELAAALAGELPDTANVEADDARPVSTACSMGALGAEFDVPGGRISVLLLSATDTAGSEFTAQSAQAGVPTDDGRQVLVVSESSGRNSSAPYSSDLTRIATTIAERY